MMSQSAPNPQPTGGNGLSEFWINAEDLQWVVYAAGAFNGGGRAAAHRPEADVAELWDRIERVGAVVGIHVNRAPAGGSYAPDPPDHPGRLGGNPMTGAAPTFGPVKRIGPSTWEMDYSLQPGHNAHIEWDHEPTPEELSVAHNPPAMRLDSRGEVLDGRRWKLGPVTVFRFKNVAPPRWVLPRLYPKRVCGGVGLRFGWNFTAYEWSIHRTDPGRTQGGES